jgi:hypothetical protein
MNQPISLRDLAASDTVKPPYGFAEFEQRRGATESRRRTGMWSAAASMAVVGLVPAVALLTQAPEPTVRVSGSTAEVPYQPALVNVGQFELTSELEDHIALLDAQISEARVYAAPPERLRQMEATRAELTDSLRRVSYAQTLLGL